MYACGLRERTVWNACSPSLMKGASTLSSNSKTVAGHGARDAPDRLGFVRDYPCMVALRELVASLIACG